LLWGGVCSWDLGKSLILPGGVKESFMEEVFCGLRIGRCKELFQREKSGQFHM
jgi:hypothetical protein